MTSLTASVANTQTVTVSFRIPEWQRGKCEAIALATGRSLSQVLQEAIASHLDESPSNLLARVEALEQRLASMPDF